MNMAPRRSSVPDPIEVRLLIVAEMLERSVAELTRVMDQLKADRLADSSDDDESQSAEKVT